jgi:hypothetical protein
MASAQYRVEVLIEIANDAGGDVGPGAASDIIKKALEATTTKDVLFGDHFISDFRVEEAVPTGN